MRVGKMDITRFYCTLFFHKVSKGLAGFTRVFRMECLGVWVEVSRVQGPRAKRAEVFRLRV